ncbi:MAG: hypothetical protein WC750_06165 [Patescibacteria group bacterium]|jgi:hypothetical protein
MKFRKKPVVVEAVRWTGKNFNEIKAFCPGIIDAGYRAPTDNFSVESWPLLINTREGQVCAQLGDWIIKGVMDDFYPCKPDIFEATYEQV